MKAIDVSCNINNLTADIEAIFKYENESDETEHAKFVFPLDESSAIYFFEALVGGKRIRAECHEATEAAATYDAAVEQGKTAFMMQENPHDGDVFSMSLGNIPAKEKIQLTLRYFCDLSTKHSELPADDAQTKLKNACAILTLPSVLNPRYTPADMPQNKRPPYDSELSLTPQPYAFSFKAMVKTSSALIDVSSSQDTFKLKYLTDDKKNSQVTLESKFAFDHDLEMRLGLAEAYTPMISVERRKEGEKTGLLSRDCLMVNFLPDLHDIAEEREERTELVFLIDRSGSMSGSNIAQAKESLLFFLKSLPTTCRFQIIGFGSTHAVLFPEAVDYTQENVNRAMDYQRDLSANMGGTEVLRALEAAFTPPLTGQGWYRQLILLTDGDVSNASQVISLVRRNRHKAGVFAIGLGEGASTALVNGVARAGGGKAVFVRSKGNLRAAVMETLDCALQVRVTQVKASWELTTLSADGKTSTPLDALTLPSIPPPVFFNDFVFTCALTANDVGGPLTGKATLSFDVMGAQRTCVVQLAAAGEQGPPDANFPLHRIAAKRQLTELADRYAELAHESEKNKTEMEQVKQQAVQLSRNANVICRFTSFVGVDPDSKVTPRAARPSPPPPSSFACRSMAMPAACPGAPMMFGCAPPPSCRMMAMSSASHEMDTTDSAAPQRHMKMKKSTGAHLFGGGGRHSSMKVGGSRSPPLEESLVVRLTNLQDISGRWLLCKGLAEAFAVDYEKLKSAVPESCAKLGEDAWATALAIAAFSLLAKSDEAEWRLMARKARGWLQALLPATNENNKKQVIDLIQAASDALLRLRSAK